MMFIGVLKVSNPTLTGTIKPSKKYKKYMRNCRRCKKVFWTTCKWGRICSECNKSKYTKYYLYP